jgi:hypothetical protein
MDGRVEPKRRNGGMPVTSVHVNGGALHKTRNAAGQRAGKKCRRDPDARKPNYSATPPRHH